MKSTHLFLIGAGVLALSSCTTSLSDPNGRGHDRDLDLYELTGQSAENGVTEADIAAAGRNANQAGSLPPRNARVLLVQSGSHQPDEELLAAYRPFCQPVIWNGRVASGEEQLAKIFAGLTLETIEGIAKTGVDRISVGSLTHSAVNLDLGLDWIRQRA